MFQGYIYAHQGTNYGLIHSNDIFLQKSKPIDRIYEVYDLTWHEGAIKYSPTKGGTYFKTVNGEDIILYSSLSAWH